MATLSLILAASNNHVIGNDNKLPWRLPNDLKHFKEKTLGKPVIMGRKTFDSLPSALPNRMNIVVTTKARELEKFCSSPDVFFVETPEEARKLAEAHLTITGQTELLVIGGAALYEHFYDSADRIYLTRVHANAEGDVSFVVNESDWNVTELKLNLADVAHKTAYTFMTLERPK